MLNGLGNSLEDKEKSGPEQDVEVQHRILETAPDDVIVSRFRFVGGLLSKLFASGVEARGVERVPEDQRETKNTWNNLLMWWSANTVLTTIPIGVLAQEFFNLTFPHAILTIFCFGALGSIFTLFIATLGPQTGLRTMIITLTIPYLLYLVSSINPGTLPLVVGIIVVGICSLIPSFIGYNMVHHYQQYAWMVMTLVMLSLLGLAGKTGFDINAHTTSVDYNEALLPNNILDFGRVVFGSFTIWAPVAADYNCWLPANTPPIKVFLLTFFGLFIPITFVETLGAFLMIITNKDYVHAFKKGGTSGLLSQFLSPWKGGGKFILFLLAFSVIANNILNTYSAALSIQALGRPFEMTPRFFWTLFCFVIYTIAGVAGRENIFSNLSSSLSILSYWTGFFIIIVMEEHFIFRRKGGKLGRYNLDDWDSPSKLPHGIAGILAGCFGVVGVVLGMFSVGYFGVLGYFAGFGLGFEFVFLLAGLTYPPLRWFEIRRTGR